MRRQGGLVLLHGPGKVVLTGGKLGSMSATGLHLRCICMRRHTSHPSFPTSVICHEMDDVFLILLIVFLYCTLNTITEVVHVIVV